MNPVESPVGTAAAILDVLLWDALASGAMGLRSKLTLARPSLPKSKATG
ncbi:MAG TPA: hypothetical protein VMT76_12740 [Puia sp.]|nr:hypothetical protein [Puia sp.]